MKFKVIAGRHVGEDKRVYNTGDIVESDHDLVSMFAEKFELVEGGGGKSKAHAMRPEVKVEGQELQDDTDKVGTHILDTEDTEKGPGGSLHLPKRTAVSKPDDEPVRGSARPAPSRVPESKRSSHTASKAHSSKSHTTHKSSSKDDDDD